MPRYVALLRGINVGGRNRVAMADLRRVVAALGHEDVVTYVQSGNVAFTAAAAPPATLAAGLAEKIATELGVRAAVVVVTADALARVIADQPWPDETTPQHLHVSFRDTPLSGCEIAAVAQAERRARDKGSPDEAAVVGGTLFLHTPNGLGRSELAAQLARLPGAKDDRSTMRNWATVLKLRELADG